MLQYKYILIAFSFLFFACNNKPQEEILATNPGTALLEESIEAMGGMERYQQLHDVTYELTYRDMVSGKQDSSTEKYLYAGELSWATYHQHTKNVAPDKEGPVLQAWNGHNAWLIVEDNFVPAPPALRMVEFGRKTSFFWMNMMFKMLDPGTRHEQLPNRNFDGNSYEIVQVTYDENIGDAQDRFILYINPVSKLVEHFLFSNAFMGPEVPPRMMHVEFQVVEGIKFPKRQWYETADWEGNIVAGGPPKSEKLYTDIKINTGIEPSLFDRPILTDIPMADIRNAYLKKELTNADTEKGHQLIALLETACGGFDHWRSFSSATFTQTADWYDNETNWTTNPQEFSMTCNLGSSDGELQLLNGPRAKTAWKIANGYPTIKAGDEQADDHKMVMHKQTYKSYWFQLPSACAKQTSLPTAERETLKEPTTILSTPLGTAWSPTLNTTNICCTYTRKPIVWNGWSSPSGMSSQWQPESASLPITKK